MEGVEAGVGGRGVSRVSSDFGGGFFLTIIAVSGGGEGGIFSGDFDGSPF